MVGFFRPDYPHMRLSFGGLASGAERALAYKDPIHWHDSRYLSGFQDC